MDLGYTVRVRRSVMNKLEKMGLVETVTEGLDELGIQGIDHAKIVTRGNSKSLYIPFEEGGLRGYAFMGRMKKENTV